MVAPSHKLSPLRRAWSSGLADFFEDRMGALLSRVSALSDNAWAYLLFLLAFVAMMVSVAMSARYPGQHEFAKDVLAFARDLATAAGVMFKAHILPNTEGGSK